MTDYGYVCVSGADRNEVRQVIKMRQLSVEDMHIFTEKQSGKELTRHQKESITGHISGAKIVKTDQ